jgi:exonuclease VII small subunit
MTEDKKRFDYSLIHVTDIDNVTMLHGKGIADLPDECTPYLANVGLLVMFQRSLAASKDCPLSLEEKQAKVDHIWEWLSNGMPKRTKIMMTAEEKAIKVQEDVVAEMEKMVASLPKAEQKLMASIIEKKKIAIAEMKSK